MNEAAHPLPASGQQTGRYVFEEHIGTGGMAEVYRARDNHLGREVAIKLFRAEAATPYDEVRREREIQLLGSLRHPGLVEIFDAGSFDDRGSLRRYIAMEYIEGNSVATRLRSGALSARLVADIGAQVADALAHVHSHDVVHRDVKPDNILLTEQAAYGYTLIAKLADFGIAQFTDATRFTDHNSVLGTAQYISPEQASGQEVGAPTDIYSLGLTLLESLTGEREYQGTAVEAALARLSRSPSVPEDLSDEWRDILAAMTATDPQARPTAHEVAATLRDIIRASILEGRAKHTSRRSRRVANAERGGTRAALGSADRDRQRKPWVLTTAIVGLAGVVLGTVVGVLLGTHVIG